jgi:hypothetical protein
MSGTAVAAGAVIEKSGVAEGELPGNTILHVRERRHFAGGHYP